MNYTQHITKQRKEAAKEYVGIVKQFIKKSMLMTNVLIVGSICTIMMLISYGKQSTTKSC